MEHVINSSSDFIWHLCQGGRGIGLLRRSPSTPKPAAASWRRRNPVQHVSAREAAPQVVVDTRDRAPGVIIEYGGAKSSAARAASRPLVRSAEFHWDSRYRGIMRTLDNLEASLQQDPDLDPTRELDELIEAMTRHFTRENACMDLVAFPRAPCTACVTATYASRPRSCATAAAKGRR